MQEVTRHLQLIVIEVSVGVRIRQAYLHCFQDNVSPHFPGAIHKHYLLKHMPHVSNKVTAKEVTGTGRGKVGRKRGNKL